LSHLMQLSVPGLLVLVHGLSLRESLCTIPRHPCNHDAIFDKILFIHVIHT
jgi:hypothetical protein